LAAAVSIVVGSFDGARGADEALPGVKAAAKSAKLKIHDAGLVRKIADDKVEIKDTGDWGFAKSAVATGILLGVVGTATAGLGLIVAAGVMGKAHDAKINDNAMRNLGKGLTTGSSALVILADPASLAGLEGVLKGAGAKVTAEGLDAETLAALTTAALAEPEASAAPEAKA